MTHAQLQQNVKVTIKSSKNTVSSSVPIIKNIVNDINKRTKNVNMASTINRQVAQQCVHSQRAGIGKKRAVDSGQLRNSIMTHRMSGSNVTATSSTGTTIKHSYPLYLVRGRGEVLPKRAKALKFENRAGKVKGYAKRAGPSKAKNYMEHADIMVRRKIPSIVESGMKNVFK